MIVGCPHEAHDREAEEYIVTERVAVIVRLLTLGRRYTTAEVAALLGMERTGAFKMLAKISRVVPLAEIDGRWTMHLEGHELW